MAKTQIFLTFGFRTADFTARFCYAYFELFTQTNENEQQKRATRLDGSFGGRGWIRTTEVTDDRFTVCSLWPLGNSPIFKYAWSWWTDSNPRPADYKSAALPTELHQRTQRSITLSQTKVFVNTFLRYFLIFAFESLFRLIRNGYQLFLTVSKFILYAVPVWLLPLRYKTAVSPSQSRT